MIETTIIISFIIAYYLYSFFSKRKSKKKFSLSEFVKENYT